MRNHLVLIIWTIRPEQNLAPWSWNNTLICTHVLCYVWIALIISTGWDAHVKLLQLSDWYYILQNPISKHPIFSQCLLRMPGSLKQITGKWFWQSLSFNLSVQNANKCHLVGSPSCCWMLTKCEVQVKINRRYSIMMNCCNDRRDPK